MKQVRLVLLALAIQPLPLLAADLTFENDNRATPAFLEEALPLSAARISLEPTNKEVPRRLLKRLNPEAITPIKDICLSAKAGKTKAEALHAATQKSGGKLNLNINLFNDIKLPDFKIDTVEVGNRNGELFCSISGSSLNATASTQFIGLQGNKLYFGFHTESHSYTAQATEQQNTYEIKEFSPTENTANDTIIAPENKKLEELLKAQKPSTLPSPRTSATAGPAIVEYLVLYEPGINNPDLIASEAATLANKVLENSLLASVVKINMLPAQALPSNACGGKPGSPCKILMHAQLEELKLSEDILRLRKATNADAVLVLRRYPADAEAGATQITKGAAFTPQTPLISYSSLAFAVAISDTYRNIAHEMLHILGASHGSQASFDDGITQQEIAEAAKTLKGHLAIDTWWSHWITFGGAESQRIHCMFMYYPIWCNTKQRNSSGNKIQYGYHAEVLSGFQNASFPGEPEYSHPDSYRYNNKIYGSSKLTHNIDAVKEKANFTSNYDTLLPGLELKSTGSSGNYRVSWVGSRIATACYKADGQRVDIVGSEQVYVQEGETLNYTIRCTHEGFPALSESITISNQLTPIEISIRNAVMIPIFTMLLNT